MTLEPQQSFSRIHQLVAPWGARPPPDAPAVCDKQLALTCAQFDAAARRENAPFAGLGLRASDRLLIVGENCVAFCVLALSAKRMDVWFVVAKARLSDREIDLFMGHAQPRRVAYPQHVSPEAAQHATRHDAAGQACEAHTP